MIIADDVDRPRRNVLGGLKKGILGFVNHLEQGEVKVEVKVKLPARPSVGRKEPVRGRYCPIHNILREIGVTSK